MRFVLANRHLLQPGGTEVHLVTIGEHLQRLGHEVVLYAPELGPFADHARRRGLDVVAELRELPEACDVTFSQDSIVVYALAERYPDALSVFRICGDAFDFQLPPNLIGGTDLIVVLSDRFERIAHATVGDVPVLRLRFPIDCDRLVPLGSIAAEPRRAVLLGNYEDRHDAVRDVWGRQGVVVERVGGERPVYDLARALAGADVVVAKNRAAVDAMACGRAVYVFDMFGGDGWVTPANYAAFEADNFAGQATDRVIDEAALADDLSGYRQEMGVVNRDLVLQHHGARDHVVALLSAIGERVPGERPAAPLRELARLVALQSSWETTAREFRQMYWPLREQAAQAEHVSAQAAHEARAATEAARTAERRREDDVAIAAESVRHAQAEREAALTERDAALAERDAALARAAEAQAREDPAPLREELATLKRTRAWRLVNAYWRLKARVRRG